MKLDSESQIKDDLGGPLSIKLKDGKSFDEYCSNHLTDYNPDRFEMLALRVHFGKETAITLYAIDKDRQEGNNHPSEKIPVKKFKLPANFLVDLAADVQECNFTLTTGNFPLENMFVINK